MSFIPATFGGLLPQASEVDRPAPDDDFWYEGGRTAFYGGYNINSQLALQLSVVMNCVKVIAETVAMLPMEVQRYDEAKDFWRRDPTHRLWNLLAVRPNRWQTAYEWKEMMTGHVALRGNAYSQKLPGPSGAIDQLIPLNPDKMTVHVMEDYSLGYEYVDDKGRTHYLDQEEILHWRGFSLDGITGLTPIEYAARSIGLGIFADQHQAAFFKNGGRPGGVLEHPGVMGERAIGNFRRDWQKLHGGPNNAGKMAILEEGMKYHELGVSNVDAQLLETRLFQTRDLARIWRMQAAKIGDNEYNTYNNTEQQALDFIADTMSPWFERICQACGRDLLYSVPGYQIAINYSKLLLADVTTLTRACAVGRQWGWLSANEARRILAPLFGLPPIDAPEADEYLTPMNMTSGRPEDNEPKEPDNERAAAVLRGMLGTYRAQTPADSRVLRNAVNGTGHRRS